MKTLAEIKSLFNTEKVFETATSFGVNEFGKYCPNVTFILPKDFEGNPLAYRSDEPTKEMIQNMNVSFNGTVGALFGDFWKSQKGGACFRPKDVATAQHVLVRVDWGGAFRDSRGSWGGVGELYFRRAASNGGGTGYDYWIFPIGFYHIIDDAEIDGEIRQSAPDFSGRAEQIRAQFAHLDRELAAKAKAQVDAKVASGLARSGLETRLMAVSEKLVALGHKALEIGETSFVCNWQDKLYTEENVAQVERHVTGLQNEHTEKDRKRLIREAFQPKFEVFRPRVETLGLEISFYDDDGVVRLSKNGYVVGNGFPYTDEGLLLLGKRLEEFEAEATRVRRETLALAEYNKAKAEAAEAGLPQDIRIWCRRGGRTNAGDGWVIGPDGQDRGNTAWYNPRHRYPGEGDKIWEQILPGEVVLKWSKSCSAAEHVFEAIHLPPEGLTEAQLERILEIQDELEDQWKGACGLASGQPSPPVGNGWGLSTKTATPNNSSSSALAMAMRKAGLK